MAVQHSPALTPMRSGLIDLSRQAEYPILLGKSFSEKRGNAAQLLNVRYNWKSKRIPQRQVITENQTSSDSYKLVVREGTSEPYKYNGTADPKTTDPDLADLALVFDKEKSAFMLESISKSLNFNLTSATTKPNIEQLPQLETINDITRDASNHQDQEELGESDEDRADAENPYDYRHFLVDARKEAEVGSATPKPVTPNMPSPAPGTSRRIASSKAATSLQSPFMGPSMSKRRKVEPKPTARGVSNTSHPASSNAAKSKSRTTATAPRGRAGPKSAEKVDSTDEEKDQAQTGRGKQAPSRVPSTAQNHTQSPQIIVDEASDLTIDMGSPPVKAKQKHRINVDAFASHSASQSRANTASASPQSRDSRANSEGDAEDDANLDDGDEDDDIEDLALPSPRETRVASNSMSRVTQDRAEEEDEDDDGLAAELEAVFDQEDDVEHETVGLGISGNQHQSQMLSEEESEVSEEE